MQRPYVHGPVLLRRVAETDRMAFGIGHMGAQLAEHQGLEQMASLRAVEWLVEPARQYAEHSAIEPVELRVLYFLDPGARPPRGQPGAEQRVGEPLETALHRGPRHR